MPEIEIRDNPGLRSFFRSITEMSFTGVMWGLWLYMLLPLVNILLWVMGFKYFRMSVIDELGYIEFLALMERMGWIVLIVFIILRVWGYYNYVMFGRRGRRKGSDPVTLEELARTYGLTVDEIKDMQLQKEVTWNTPVNAVKAEAVP